MDGTVGSVVPCVSVFTFLNGFLPEIIAVLTAVFPWLYVVMPVFLYNFLLLSMSVTSCLFAHSS